MLMLESTGLTLSLTWFCSFQSVQILKLTRSVLTIDENPLCKAPKQTRRIDDIITVSEGNWSLSFSSRRPRPCCFSAYIRSTGVAHGNCFGVVQTMLGRRIGFRCPWRLRLNLHGIASLAHLRHAGPPLHFKWRPLQLTQVADGKGGLSRPEGSSTTVALR
jgi:hypothetical protein